MITAAALYAVNVRHLVDMGIGQERPMAEGQKPEQPVEAQRDALPLGHTIRRRLS